MGIINVYTGPMKCGKSQKIFNELKRQLIAWKNIKLFKPLLDNRAGDAVISTRAGNSINAINIQSINELEKYDADCVTMENGTALLAKKNYPEFVKQYLKYNQRKGNQIWWAC